MKRNELVVKSNALVNAMFDLGLQANRFLAFTISRLDRSLEPLPGKPVEMEIDVRAFAEAFEVDIKNAYREVENLADQLQRKIIQFEKEPGRRIKVGIITRQEYLDGEGRVWIRFDEDLVPHLLGLKEKFTKYRIKDVYQFQRASTWRVYELLKQNKEIGRRDFQLDEFKIKIGVGGLYSIFADLKKRILDPSIDEINTVSDLLAQWEQIKKGRRIVGIRFFIKENQETKTTREKIRAKIEKAVGDKPLKNPEFSARLQADFGLAPKQADQLAKKLAGREKHVEKILAKISQDHKAGKVENISKYTFSLLKHEITREGLPLE